jgi:hypothetical protein
MSTYNNGFAGGLTVRGMPVTLAHPGKVFFVGNSGVKLPGERNASDSSSNKGSILDPFATIDYAVGQCVAGRGDIIFVKPGHVETITAADAIDIDVNGVAVIGLGVGDAQPRIHHNHADATVAIDADNVTLMNIRMSADVTTVGIGVNVKAGSTGCTISKCRFDVVAEGTDEYVITIDIKAGNTGTLIEGNTIDNGIAGAAVGIKLTGASDKVVIKDNVIRGDYSTANINGITTLSTRLLIDGNLLENGIGGDLGTEPGIELLTGTTGTIQNNNIVCNLATKAASIVADTCLLFENYYNEDISSTATGGIIGTASADD